VSKIRLFQQEVTEIPYSVPFEEKGKNFNLLSVTISFFFILVPEEKCQLLDDKNGDMNKTDNVRVNVTLKRVRKNHYCSGKAISITYYECVFVALFSKQSACAVLCYLWPVWLLHIFLHIFS
jgi:hypothetical protein